MEHRVYFFGLYRFLALESASYPQINYNDILKLFKTCHIITEQAKSLTDSGDEDVIMDMNVIQLSYLV
jgi:hypothetical protein